MTWKVDSWRSKPIKQQPQYQDQDKLDQVFTKIRRYPPLFFSGEVDKLRRQLAEAAEGKRFLLQGGDCAERFKDCTPEIITNKIKILIQMSVILAYGARKPVVRVGRIAGQYAKPRSSDFETIDGKKIPSFRGDNINSFDPSCREPDPERLLQSYHLSSMTLNYVRAMILGGFADLHHPENWDLSFFRKGRGWERYQNIISSIHDSVEFLQVISAAKEESLGSIDFYTSHEGLFLGFEECMTRTVTGRNGFYNLGAHMLWIGDRTRQLDGAHVEYFRGIVNPVGIKVGPSSDPDEIVEVLKTLNPDNELGKINVIARYGHESVAEHLPAMIQAIRGAGQKVLFSCDPMHGNIIKTKGGTKTRDFSDILSELKQHFSIHSQEGSFLGGVHFELTGEDVTECVGGAEGLTEGDLTRQYETYCDPRLNYNQSLEMAFLISELLKRENA